MGEIDRLLAGFQAFRATYFDQRPNLYRRLVECGQQPKVLVIACSDSRVDPALLLNAEPGDLFVVRNLANLVPPHQPDEHCHGTSAAIEFAVRDLKVDYIIVLGHSGCGGIQALCRAQAGQPMEREYLNRWVSIAAPACCTSPSESSRATEQASIVRSMENLCTFPWVHERLNAGILGVEGWWFDLDKGDMWRLNPGINEFIRCI